MRYLGIVVFLLLGLQNGVAQEDVLVVHTNKQKIKSDRYKDIKGSPMYFKDWVVGDIISKEGEVTKDQLVNYNIKEDAIEVKVNEEEMIVLSEVEVDKIIISKDKNKENFPDHVEGPVVVRSGNIPGLHCKFMVSIFEGEKVKLLKLITVKVTDVTVQEVGRTVRMQRFNQYNSYFYTAPGSFSEIKLKKKSILEALKHTDKVNSFLAKEKNKLKKEKDLLSLFKFYDTLF